jgi:hypothetical protein
VVVAAAHPIPCGTGPREFSIAAVKINRETMTGPITWGTSRAGRLASNGA